MKQRVLSSKGRLLRRLPSWGPQRRRGCVAVTGGDAALSNRASPSLTNYNCYTAAATIYLQQIQAAPEEVWKIEGGRHTRLGSESGQDDFGAADNVMNGEYSGETRAAK